MELRQIRSFLVVARHGSFVAASRVLHLSQPALGQQVRSLEADLGVQLLERHARGVRLTEAGGAFVVYAERMLGLAAEARDALQPFRRPTPKLSLVVTPSASRVLSPDLMAACDAEPRLELSIRHGLTSDALRQLQDGRVDVALCYEPAAFSLRTEALYAEAFCLVGPADLMPFETGEIGFADLGGTRLVLDAAIRRLVEQPARELGVVLQIVGEVEPAGATAELLIRNRCCSILSQGLLAAEVASGRLRSAIIRDPPLVRTLYFNASESASWAEVERLLGLLRDLVARVIDAGAHGWRRPA